jgi:Outer membrane protein beta-barrel domain
MYRKLNIRNMRKLNLIVIVSLLFLGTSAVAQEMAFGLKGGLNLSEIKIDDPEASYNSKTGYHAGIFVRSKFDKIAIQPELLLYTQRGDFSGPGYTGNEDFTYLTIPLMVKFYPVMGLNLQVGPQFGFLLDGERTSDTVFGTIKQDIKDQYESSDFAVSAGAGYDFSFGLSLDARYNIGVKDINNATNGDEAKSRVFLISIGWNFLK